MRDLLGRFGLHGEIVDQQVEAAIRRRAQPGGAGAAGGRTASNVLVLDEPTNHLDIWACDALEKALQGVRGHGASSSATTATSSTASPTC